MAPDPNNNQDLATASPSTRIEMPTVPTECSVPRSSTRTPSSSPSRSQSRFALSSPTNGAANEYLYFDANTFKQVKRLYCGMLMVAMAYSVTMIIMMIVLYKTLPQSMNALQGSSPFMGGALVAGSAANSPKLSYRSFGSSLAGTPSQPVEPELPKELEKEFELVSGQTNQKLPRDTSATTGGAFRAQDGRMVTHETARTYLDQVIAINFLTLILYSLAFYAAHRELYTLTLAFTSTLSFTMMFSVVKIFVEGVHFPNNFMSLLLRVSIVFVALVYLGQLRRKQHFIRNMWLSPNSLLNHPALRGSQMTPTQTAQLIREFLATSNGHGSNSPTTFKTDDDLLAEFHDLPPNYEEALRCPVPNSPTSPGQLPAGAVIPMQTLHSNAPTRAASSLTLAPPSFDELRGSRTSLALSEPPETTINVSESECAQSQSNKPSK